MLSKHHAISSWRRYARALLLPALLAAAVSPSAAQRYIAFGDSITEGINFDDCPCLCAEECGYPRRLEALLQATGRNATVENRGLGGERTPEGLTRLDEVLEGGGDVLLLMEGTNDISRMISPETTLFNLTEMARKAAVAGLSTAHATLIPRYPEATVDIDNVVNGQLAMMIRGLAHERNRLLIDPFEVFSSTLDVFERFYAVFPGDPVGHPNAAGYDHLTNIFFSVLVDLDFVPPVLGAVTPAFGTEEFPPFGQIHILLYDFGRGVAAGSVRMLVNGEEVSFTLSGSPAATEITYSPVEPLPEFVSVWVEAGDRTQSSNMTAFEATRFSVSDELPEPCLPDEFTLCIDDQPGDLRFKVSMSWQTAANGGLAGQAFVTPLDALGFPTGGLLSFFEGNPEVLVKVLNGCGVNGSYWVFGSPATTLGFDIRITDTLARMRGAEPAVYRFEAGNVDGDFAAPFFDIGAFATCDFQ